MSSTKPTNTTFAAIFSVVFLDNLGFAIVVPYLFFYVQALGGSTLLYGVLLASYSLMSFVFTPIVARLSDRYGRRKIILEALAVATAAYLLFGVAEVLWVLFLARMLSGTTAATVPVAQAYIADVTTKQQRLKYMGLLGAAAGLAFIFGPAIGGTLSNLFGYSVPSFLASALAFSNLVSAYFLLPEPVAFNIKRTTVPFRALLGLVKQRAMVLLLAMYFLFFVAFVFMQSALSPWLQAVFGYGSLQTGLVFFFVGAVSVFTQAVLLPRLNRKFANSTLVLLGVACFVVSMGLLSFIANIPFMLAASAVAAFGFGVQIATFNTMISLNSSESAQGGTLGVAWAIAGAAQSVAPVLAASVFGLGVSAGLVGLVFFVAALTGLAIVPLALYFRKTG